MTTSAGKWRKASLMRAFAPWRKAGSPGTSAGARKRPPAKVALAVTWWAAQGSNLRPLPCEPKRFACRGSLKGRCSFGISSLAHLTRAQSSAIELTVVAKLWQLVRAGSCFVSVLLASTTLPSLDLGGELGHVLRDEERSRPASCARGFDDAQADRSPIAGSHVVMRGLSTCCRQEASGPAAENVRDSGKSAAGARSSCPIPCLISAAGMDEKRASRQLRHKDRVSFRPWYRDALG